jgi:hypothetical protein
MEIASVFDLETLQLDVRNAFVHSTLDEEVYCERTGIKQSGLGGFVINQSNQRLQNNQSIKLSRIQGPD